MISEMFMFRETLPCALMVAFDSMIELNPKPQIKDVGIILRMCAQALGLLPNRASLARVGRDRFEPSDVLSNLATLFDWAKMLDLGVLVRVGFRPGGGPRDVGVRL